MWIVPCNTTLSGGGNDNGEKTTIGLISKKATLHVQHTFLVHFFAIVLHDYNVKVMLHGTIRNELSVFVFIDSLVVSASQDVACYAFSRQNNLELHVGCHTCWLSYFTMPAYGADGRSVGRSGGRTVTWLPKFLGWVDYHIFLGRRPRLSALFWPLKKHEPIV